jgi:hypothetical protein
LRGVPKDGRGRSYPILRDAASRLLRMTVEFVVYPSRLHV